MNKSSLDRGFGRCIVMKKYVMDFSLSKVVCFEKSSITLTIASRVVLFCETELLLCPRSMTTVQQTEYSFHKEQAQMQKRCR